MDTQLPFEPTERRAVLGALLIATAGSIVVLASLLSHPVDTTATGADLAVVGIHLLFFAATSWCGHVLLATLAADYRRFLALRRP